MSFSKTVLVIITKSDAKARQACSRLREYGASRRWDVALAECYLDADGSVTVDQAPIHVDGSLSALVDRLAPDGVFICGDLNYFDDRRKLTRLGVPVVATSGALAHPCPARAGARGFVVTDEESVVTEAARHLLSLGFDDFGYVPFFREADWSRQRGELFRRRVVAAGKAFHLYERRGHIPRTPFEPESLASWLEGLPKPCGILAANDVEGEEVLRLCVQCGFRIPNDMAVLGVDNRTEICENISPTLSSVAMDLPGQYAEAASLLAELMESGTRGQVVRTIPVRGVVERASTRLMRDARVARAQEFIRVHACEEGFAVRDVVMSMCVCRTLADRLFRKVAGTTILNEIHAARIDRAKELLAAGKKPDFVAAECGYASYDDFRRVFRQRTGTTASKWARSARHVVRE